MKISQSTLLALLLTLASAMPTFGEDIDVYYGSANVSVTPDAMVILGLDWRPNFFSTVCNGECTEFHDILGSFLECEDGTCATIKRYDLFRAALKLVLTEISETELTNMKFGLMLNHDHFAQQGSICEGLNPSKNCSNGGYMLLGFQDLNVSGERDLLFAKLDALPNPQGGQSHKYQGAELYFELFRYLTGQGIYNGHNGWFDFGSDGEHNIDDAEDAGSGVPRVPPTIMAWDEQIEDGDSYINPLAGASECSKIYAINVLHQVSQQDSDSDQAIKATKSEGGMEGISNKVEFTSVIGFLNDVDLADGSVEWGATLPGKNNVTSYFIVDPTKINTTTNGYAEAGGTGSAIAFSDDPEELIRALRKILQEILGVSTTFVTTSVAANTLNRAQTLEALYVALFEPNAEQGPFWVGNVKRMMIRVLDVPVVDENGDPVLDENGNPVTAKKAVVVDALNATTSNPQSAISASDGRIAKSALTFWTDKNSLAPAPEGGDPNYTDDSDGREVARGGVGQVIPGFLPDADPAFDNATGRRVFTEPATWVAGTPAAMTALDAYEETAIDLLQNSPALYETVMDCSGCTYATETDDAIKLEARKITINMIKFARGYDVPFDDGNYGTPDGRFWWVADPLHSRPLVLNYGERGSYTQGTSDVRVLTAGNGGVLHMVKDRDPDGGFNGAESWAFIPRQFIPLQRRLMEDSLGSLHLPGIPAVGEPRVPPHPYALDGSASSLVIDNDFDGTIETGDGDKVYVYICTRRGGKGCYALDVSDPDTPKLMWIIDKNTAGFGQMGQTWALMRPGLVSYLNDSNQSVVVPVLFFSGGYNGDDGSDGAGDLGKDSRVKNANGNTEIVGTDDYEGNAVYILDARDGSLIWKAEGPSVAGDTANGWDSTSLTFQVSTLKDSIPASINMFDSDGDRISDRFYVADTGGNLWRGDIVPGPRSAWKMTRVMSVGRHAVSPADNTNDRRFFVRADVARAVEPDDSQAVPGQPFDAVVLMSGDRAHPLGRDVENWAYMFRDKNIVSGDPPASVVTHNQLQDLTNNCLQDGVNTDCLGLDDGSLPNLNNGWKMRFNHCEDLSEAMDCGEKGISRPLIINRTVYFNSYVPPDPDSTDSCAPREGSGLFYGISLFDATAVYDFNLANNSGGVVLDRFDELASPGIPPAPVALAPDLLLRPDLQPQKIKGVPSAPTFWYERYLK